MSTSTDSEQPIGELIRDLSEQTTTLVRQELALARAEIADKGKHAASGAGLVGGAGILGAAAIGALTAAAIIGLATAIDGWLAALVVGVVLAALAGAAALLGKRRVTRAIPPLPERAVQSTKEDIQWAKQSAQQ